MTPLQRFEAKILKYLDGCWLWCGYITPQGYGQFLLEGKPTPAHRASWVMHNGPVPPSNQIAHTCKEPLCVRPEHLRLCRTYSAKLDAARVREIRALARSGVQNHVLALSFNVSSTTISNITRRKTWKGV